MTDITTAAGATSPPSEAAYKTVQALVDAELVEWVYDEDPDLAAIIIQDKAIAPALAQHQQAVDELVAALDRWFRLATNPQISAETYWRAWPEVEEQCRTTLAAWRHLATEKKDG